MKSEIMEKFEQTQNQIRHHLEWARYHTFIENNLHAAYNHLRYGKGQLFTGFEEYLGRKVREYGPLLGILYKEIDRIQEVIEFIDQEGMFHVNQESVES